MATAAVRDLGPARLPRNGLVRNLAYLFGGQVSTWGLTFLWTVVVPRKIGPLGMGQLVTVWSASGILIVVVGLGTRVVVVTEIARNAASAGRQVSAAIAARLVLYFPGAGLMALYILFAHFDRYEVILLAVATLSIPFVLANEVLGAAFQGLERMQYIAYLDVIYKSVVTTGAIVLVLLGFHVLALVVLGSSTAVLVFVTSIFWARRHFDLVWTVSHSQVVSMAVASLPFWATTMFYTFYLWIDSVMLAFLATPTEVGWYGVPMRLFGALFFVPVIIGTATLARLTAAFADGATTFRRELSPIVASTLVISFPVAAGTIAIARPLVDLLYGSSYQQSAVVLMILGVAIPATYLSIVVNQSLIASNRQIIWTKVMAFGAVVNPLLNMVAIPASHAAWHDAALGAALSLVATEAMMAGAGLYLMRTYLDPALIARVARAVLAALTMGLLVYGATPLGIPVQLAVGALVFAILSLALRLIRPVEMELGREYARRLGTRLVGARAK